MKYIWLTVGAILAFDSIWTFQLYRRWKSIEALRKSWFTTMEESRNLRKLAIGLFDTAQVCNEASKQENLDFRVCGKCDRIVTKHITDEAGNTLCVICAKELAMREGN
jgi:hypothetical protein